MSSMESVQCRNNWGVNNAKSLFAVQSKFIFGCRDHSRKLTETEQLMTNTQILGVGAYQKKALLRYNFTKRSVHIQLYS